MGMPYIDSRPPRRPTGMIVSDGPIRHVPVLDDTRQPDRSVYWSDPPVETDWQAIAVRHSRTIADQLAVMVELREQVSSVSMDATIWKVLALVGWSVAVLAVVMV